MAAPAVARVDVAAATRAPNPSGWAGGDERPVASTTATLAVTTATTRATAATEADGTDARAVIWATTTKSSVAMPSGPTSGRRMIARAASGGRRLPSPSPVSAS